ncbi:MAG: N-acetyltransferase family protein [Cyanobacteria bacterium P01_E01_bin.34]
MTSLAIRSCQPSDYQAMADIYNESIATGRSTMDTSPVGPEKFQTIHKNLGNREVLFVAETGGLDETAKVVGWGAVRKYSDRYGYRVCCETSIYLTLNETGKGYGSLLQEELLKAVEEFNYHHVLVRIMTVNQESIRFHKKFGFEQVGVLREVGYFRDRWHDVTIMQLVLPHVMPVGNI